MKIRIIAATAAIAALPLMAACGTQGTAERDDNKPAAKADKDTADCGPDSDLSQADWMKHCAEDAGDDKAPDTELKLGDTFKYKDGLKVTVTRIAKFTDFDPDYGGAEPNQTPFRIDVKFQNDSSKPVNLDEISVNGQGATKGGDAEFTLWGDDTKDVTGRLAPGQSDTKNSDGVLDKKYGTQMVVTVTRMTDDADIMADDPNWTGPIR